MKLEILYHTLTSIYAAWRWGIFLEMFAFLHVQSFFRYFNFISQFQLRDCIWRKTFFFHLRFFPPSSLNYLPLDDELFCHPYLLVFLPFFHIEMGIIWTKEFHCRIDGIEILSGMSFNVVSPKFSLPIRRIIHTFVSFCLPLTHLTMVFFPAVPVTKLM